MGVHSECPPIVLYWYLVCLVLFNGRTAVKTAARQQVRYEGRVPKTLRAWIERHAADKVYEVHHGGGFSTDSGMAYDISTRDGWCVTFPDRMHTVIEPTVAAVLDSLRTLQPCACDQCVAGMALDAQRSTGDRQ